MNANESDALLIQEVINGDENAFNQLYEKYYRLVYFIAFEMCRNDADAKDILQETFIQIQHSIAALQDPENFKPWLNRIVINKCKNLFRSRKSVELDQDDLWYQYHVSEDRFYMLPEDKMHMENDQKVVHELLGMLSDIQREVLIMRYFEQMTMQEMAEALDVPVGTVKTRLLYGKNRLKELILEYEEKNQVKVDFRVEAASMIGLFAYAYQHTAFPNTLEATPVTTKRKQYVSDQFLNIVAAALFVVFLGSSIMGLQAYNNKQNKDDRTIQVVQDNDKIKGYYFQLMDWACCKDDMLVKTKADFDEVMPIVEAMKASHSAYLERLTKDQWIQNFEAVYEQLL